MDAAAFEQVYGSFRDFHALRAAVWPPGDAGAQPLSPGPAGTVWGAANAENLSETVPGSARGMQRFLTDSPWDDEVIIGRLQESWEPGWSIRKGCGCWTAATFPSRGGSRWEWPGSTAGGWGRWPTARRGCSWPMSARWDGHWFKGLYLPEKPDKDRCEAAGVPEDRQGYPPRRSWPWRWWGGHRSGAT